MSAAVNIVINDGAGSPVAHTFTPRGKDDKGVLWYEQTVPAPSNGIAAKRLSYKQTRTLDPQKQLTGQSVVRLALWVPTPETLGNNSGGFLPPPTLAYQEKAFMELTLAERSLKQERKDTRVLFANLLLHASVAASVDDLDVIYIG